MSSQETTSSSGSSVGDEHDVDFDNVVTTIRNAVVPGSWQRSVLYRIIEHVFSWESEDAAEVKRDRERLRNRLAPPTPPTSCTEGARSTRGEGGDAQEESCSSRKRRRLDANVDTTDPARAQEAMRLDVAPSGGDREGLGRVEQVLQCPTEFPGISEAVSREDVLEFARRALHDTLCAYVEDREQVKLTLCTLFFHVIVGEVQDLVIYASVVDTLVKAARERRNADAARSPSAAPSPVSTPTLAADVDTDEGVSTQRMTVDVTDSKENMDALAGNLYRAAYMLLIGEFPIKFVLFKVDEYRCYVRSYRHAHLSPIDHFQAQRQGQLELFGQNWLEVHKSFASLVRVTREIVEPRLLEAEQPRGAPGLVDSAIATAECRPAIAEHANGGAMRAMPALRVTESVTDSGRQASRECLSEPTPASLALAVSEELAKTRLPWTGTRVATMLRELSGGTVVAKAAPVHECSIGALVSEADPTGFLQPALGRTVFNGCDTCSLLTPAASDAEVEDFVHWMQMDFTSTDRTDAHEGGEKEEGGNSGPRKYPEDPMAGIITFLSPTRGVVSLRFRPLLSFLGFDFGNAMYPLYSCDACNLQDIKGGFEAFFFDAVDTHSFANEPVKHSFGYHICIPCAVHVYRQAVLRLAAALHPDPHVRRPFEYGAGSRIHIRAVRTSRPTPDRAAPHTGTDTDDVTIDVEVGLAPYGAWPVAWVVTPAAHAAMANAFPPDADGALAGLEMTAQRHRALAAPPTPFNGCTAPVATVTSVCTPFDDSDAAGRPEDCPICLQPLSSGGPPLRTRCGHWFHVPCITAIDSGGGTAGEGEGEDEGEEPVEAPRGCPLCRRPDFMPSLDSDELCDRNVYRLRITLPRLRTDVRAAEGGTVAVAVATLLSTDGAYHNPTNVAACVLLHVTPAHVHLADNLDGGGGGAGDEGRPAAPAPRLGPGVKRIDL